MRFADDSEDWKIGRYQRLFPSRLPPSLPPSCWDSRPSAEACTERRTSRQLRGCMRNSSSPGYCDRKPSEAPMSTRPTCSRHNKTRAGGGRASATERVRAASASAENAAGRSIVLSVSYNAVSYDAVSYNAAGRGIVLSVSYNVSVSYNAVSYNAAGRSIILSW